jgi:hypothetical protein
MEWFLILSAFVVGEISGMWLAAMMRPEGRRNEDIRLIHNQAATVRQSWKANAALVLVKPKISGSRTVDR